MMLHIANCTLTLVMGRKKNYVSMCHECWMRSHIIESYEIMDVYIFILCVSITHFFYNLDVKTFDMYI
jgi:hypothetical protein